jgi:hypothetical protein
MSVIIEYNQSTDPVTGLDAGSRSGTVSMKQPLYLDPNRKKAFRVLRAIISNEIPNIYSSGGYDNTLCKISRDGGSTWTIVGLRAGIYSVSMINTCINDVGSNLGWWTSTIDPGFDLNINPATHFIYVKMDSTKLAVGGTVLAIDFSNSRLYEVLGYELANLPLVDGTLGAHIFSATLPPELDTQGTYLDVLCDIVLGTRWTNGQLSNILCRVPMISDANEVVYPSGSTGMVSPFVPATIPSIIQSFSIQIRNGRGQDAYFTMGNVIIELEITDL